MTWMILLAVYLAIGVAVTVRAAREAAGEGASPLATGRGWLALVAITALWPIYLLVTRLTAEDTEEPL